MRKAKMILLGTLLVTASAAWASTAATPTQTSASGISQYELKDFTADFVHFKIGDTVPALYRTEQYDIKQWQLRNLPAPQAGDHWTYMGGSYVLITNDNGKILKAYDGEIFYHR